MHSLDDREGLNLSDALFILVIYFYQKMVSARQMLGLGIRLLLLIYKGLLWSLEVESEMD